MTSLYINIFLTEPGIYHIVAHNVEKVNPFEIHRRHTSR
jgi:hypothetical protein